MCEISFPIVVVVAVLVWRFGKFSNCVADRGKRQAERTPSAHILRNFSRGSPRGNLSNAISLPTFVPPFSFPPQPRPASASAPASSSTHSWAYSFVMRQLFSMRLAFIMSAFAVAGAPRVARGLRASLSKFLKCLCIVFLINTGF